VIRVAPFIASLAGIVLFTRLAVNLVEGYAIPLAVLIFSGIAMNTSYAAIAKPYALDVLFVLVLYLSTISALRNEWTSWPIVLLAILGLIAPLFSYASVFAIAASATVIVSDAVVLKSRKRLIEVSVTVGTWLTVLLTIYFFHSDTLSHLRRSFPFDTITSVSSLRNAAGNIRQVLGVAPYSNYLRQRTRRSRFNGCIVMRGIVHHHRRSTNPSETLANGHARTSAGSLCAYRLRHWLVSRVSASASLPHADARHPCRRRVSSLVRMEWIRCRQKRSDWASRASDRG
jgi:hypothetical protein